MDNVWFKHLLDDVVFRLSGEESSLLKIGGMLVHEIDGSDEKIRNALIKIEEAKEIIKSI